MVLELLAALSLAAMPQDTGRLPVYVNFNGNDIVGQRLKYQLSQSLARSSTLSAAVNADRSIFIVNLTTLGSPAGETHQTIYSVSYLLRDGEGLDGYLDGTVAFCGSDRLPECAESIVADVDAQRTLFLEVLANLEDNLSRLLEAVQRGRSKLQGVPDE